MSGFQGHDRDLSRYNHMSTEDLEAILRHCVLYQMALTAVVVNPEMKELYRYLKTRAVNPL